MQKNQNEEVSVKIGRPITDQGPRLNLTSLRSGTAHGSMDPRSTPLIRSEPPDPRSTVQSETSNRYTQI
jgi:hypothetical protein